MQELRSIHLKYKVYINIHNKLTMMTLLTPSECQIEVDPLSLVGSKHFHQKDVNEDSFTECPGEGSQEEVVQQGCHNFADILVNGRICMQIDTELLFHQTFSVHDEFH